MIDMTFQLIAFFMFAISFTDAEKDDRITLPLSQLAKPPESPFEHPIYIHMQSDGKIASGGQDMSPDQLRLFLFQEARLLELREKSPSDATVIIRADASAPIGLVQEIVKTCQEAKFDRFALRAKEGASP